MEEYALPKSGRQWWRMSYRNLEGSSGGKSGLLEEALPNFGRQRGVGGRECVTGIWWAELEERAEDGGVEVAGICLLIILCLGVVLTPSMEVLGMLDDDKALGAVITSS